LFVALHKHDCTQAFHQVKNFLMRRTIIFVMALRRTAQVCM